VNQSNDPDAKALPYANYVPKSVCVFEENAPTASYQNDKELLRDIALLANSMMPLHTLQEMRSHMQPRARVKWDKYLQRAAEMTTKLEKEYAYKLGPSPNIVPDLQFFKKPLEDLRNLTIPEALEIRKEDIYDDLSLNDNELFAPTQPLEEQEKPEEKTEKFLNFGKVSDGDTSEFTDIPLDGASAFGDFATLLENFMEAASEYRTVDLHDVEGQRAYDQKMIKDHQQIEELYDHCVNNGFQPDSDSHIKMPAPAIGPKEVPLGEGWRVKLKEEDEEDDEEEVKYVKWYELEAALIFFEDEQGVDGASDYGQEKVMKDIFHKDQKEEIVDELVYKYQEPKNILLEIIKDKESGKNKLVSSQRYAEIEEKFRSLSPLAIPTKELAQPTQQQGDQQTASEHAFDALRLQMRRRIEHDQVDAYLPFLYLIDYWRECLEVHPDSFEVMLNTMTEEERPIFEKNQHFALEQMVKKLYKRLPDVGAYFTTRLTIPPPTMKDSEGRTNFIEQLESKHNIIRPRFSYAASIHYVMKAYPEFLQATRDTLLKDDDALKQQYISEMGLFCEQYDQDEENFEKKDFDKSNVNDVRVKLLNTLSSTIPDGEFKEKVAEILKSYEGNDIEVVDSLAINDSEQLGVLNNGGEEYDDDFMETAHPDEWANEFNQEDREKGDAESLDGQKLYSFLMTKLNRPKEAKDTKLDGSLPKNQDECLPDEEVDDKELKSWGAAPYEDEDEMEDWLWARAAQKGLIDEIEFVGGDDEDDPEGDRDINNELNEGEEGLSQDEEEDESFLQRASLNVKSITDKDYDNENDNDYDYDELYDDTNLDDLPGFKELVEEEKNIEAKMETPSGTSLSDEIELVDCGSELPLLPEKNTDDNDQYAGDDAVKPPPTVFKRIAIISFKLKQIYISEVEMPLDASENGVEEDVSTHQKIHKSRIVDIPPRWLQEMKKVRWPDHSDELIEQVHHMPGRMVFEKELGDNDMIRKLSRQTITQNE
jgi:hypothetical protein